MKLRLFFLATLFIIGVWVAVGAQTTADSVVVAAVAPVYPAIAATAHAVGDVTVDVKISASGTVTSARAVEGHVLLKAAGVSAAHRWKFAPAKESTTERTARLTFTFLETDQNVPDDERTAVFMPPYTVQITVPKRGVIQTNNVH